MTANERKKTSEGNYKVTFIETMSRRPSHASVTGLRRGSLADSSKAKRVSLKDGTLGNLGNSRLASVTEIKEGDVFYKTEKIYPSIPEHAEDIYITLARWPKETRTGSIISINRDDTATPTENNPGYDRDR